MEVEAAAHSSKSKSASIKGHKREGVYKYQRLNIGHMTLTSFVKIENLAKIKFSIFSHCNHVYITYTERGT